MKNINKLQKTYQNYKKKEVREQNENKNEQMEECGHSGIAASL